MPRPITFTSRTGRTHELPSKWDICQNCRGNGTHDHPAFSNGITSSEWQEWDYDDREHYLSGRYDVQCRECKGSGKVQVVDEDLISNKRLSILLSHYYHLLQERDYYDRIRASERRMGA